MHGRGVRRPRPRRRRARSRRRAARRTPGRRRSPGTPGSPSPVGRATQDRGAHREPLALRAQHPQLGRRAEPGGRLHRLLRRSGPPGDDVVHRVGHEQVAVGVDDLRAGRRGRPRSAGRVAGSVSSTCWPSQTRRPAHSGLAGKRRRSSSTAAGSPARRSISRPSASLRCTPRRTSPPRRAARRTRSDRAVICQRVSSSWTAWSRSTAAASDCALPGACSSPAAVGGVGSTAGSRSSTQPYAPSRRGTSRAIEPAQPAGPDAP